MAWQASIDTADRIERQDRRFAVVLPALLVSGDHSIAVRLRDLSRGGACAEAPTAPAVGCAVRLRVERLTIEAHIAWTRGLRFGLAFDQPISATSLLVLLGRNRAQVPV